MRKRKGVGAEWNTGPGVRGLTPPRAKHHLQNWGLEPLGKEQGRVAMGLGAGLRWRKRKGPAPSPRPLGVPGSVRPPQTSGHAVPVHLYRGERAGPTGRREAAGSPTRKVRVKQK